MNDMKVTAIIEQNSKGRYSAYISDERIKFGVLGEGKTVEETIEDFKIGYEEMKETYLSEGIEFQELEFDFKYDAVHEFGKSLSRIDFIWLILINAILWEKKIEV